MLTKWASKHQDTIWKTRLHPFSIIRSKVEAWNVSKRKLRSNLHAAVSKQCIPHRILKPIFKNLTETSDKNRKCFKGHAKKDGGMRL